MKPTTAIAISGGVDSMMAAYLIKQQGHNAIGIHFITGFEAGKRFPYKTYRSGLHPATDIGRQLGIPVELFDIRTEFKHRVVDYFCREYLNGQTPNPCMVCNPSIKFGAVLSFAQQIGASRLATGHYARVTQGAKGNFNLFKGIDSQKDQSYFLARLTQKQLARALFPLGDLKKSDVKKWARKLGLQPVAPKESQDVCFIKDNDYGDFLLRQTGLKTAPGPIVDVKGKQLGQHNGLHLFTVGQRRGINCPAPAPYYVIQIDSENNRLIVGSKSDLFASACRVVDINWISAKPSKPVKICTRVRYRHKEVVSTLIPQGENEALIQFEAPQAAITPGQGAVFYRDAEVLGGGWITSFHS
jgi:tRNA-specific 2-thiouridylase